MTGPSLRGAALHLDCHAGIAGDMTVAALVDLGVPEAVVREALAALRVDGYAVRFERVQRGALMGLKFHVEIAPVERAAHEHEHAPAIHVHGHPHEHRHQHAHHGAHAHRHYAEIRSLIERAPLGDGVRRRALAIFDRLAAVEARLHGVPVAEVAFHEVGAIDSIVDVVASAAALDWLAPARVTCRPVPLGHGSVSTAHGLLPIPAPATLELLRGAPVEDGGSPFELTTPTGAAILAATVDEYRALPPLVVHATGWGAGDRELPDRPNLLRAIAGAPAPAAADASGDCVVLEANVDDTTPELLAPLLQELLAAGARDAWLQPVLMKKGRPGHLVAALCDPARADAVERAIFRGSSTIGVRRHAVARTVLPRRLVPVETPFGRVNVKVADGPDGENAAPEFEECRALAEAGGVPLKRVWAEALAAYYRR